MDVLKVEVEDQLKLRDHSLYTRAVRVGIVCITIITAEKGSFHSSPERESTGLDALARSHSL